MLLCNYVAVTMMIISFVVVVIIVVTIIHVNGKIGLP